MTVVLVGATAVGKTSLAVELALRFAAAGRRAEVINADSMLLYRGMDIGTASAFRRRASRGAAPPDRCARRDRDINGGRLSAARSERDHRLQHSRRGAHRRRWFSTVCPSHRGRLRVPGYRPGSSSGLESELERIGSRSLHRKLASVDLPPPRRSSLAMVAGSSELWRLAY